jgi:hypothetical protein
MAIVEAGKQSLPLKIDAFRAPIHDARTVDASHGNDPTGIDIHAHGISSGASRIKRNNVAIDENASGTKVHVSYCPPLLPRSSPRWLMLQTISTGPRTSAGIPMFFDYFEFRAKIG